MNIDSEKAFISSVVIKRGWVGVGIAWKITWKVNLGYIFELHVYKR